MPLSIRPKPWACCGIRSACRHAACPRPGAKLYVLAVGISKYRDPNLELEFAAKDAMDFAKVIAGQKGFLYQDVIVQHIPERNATCAEITKWLAWLRREVTAQDMGMLFFSGHGKQDADGRFYFLSVEAEEENLMGTAVSKDTSRMRWGHSRARRYSSWTAAAPAAWRRGTGARARRT